MATNCPSDSLQQPQQVPNNEEEEDVMDAMPLLAATAAMQAEPTEQQQNCNHNLISRRNLEFNIQIKKL